MPLTSTAGLREDDDAGNLLRSEPLFDDLVIRSALPGEEEVVLDVLAEAAEWLPR